jgi:hypothetical protein
MTVNLKSANELLKKLLDKRLVILEKEGKYYLQRIDTQQEIEVPEKAVKRLATNFMNNEELTMLHFLYDLDVPYLQLYYKSRTETYYESTNTTHELYLDERCEVVEGNVFTYRKYKRRGIPEIYRVSYTIYNDDITYVLFIPLIPATIRIQGLVEKQVRSGRKVRSERYLYFRFQKWDGYKLIEDIYEKLPQ